MLGYASSSEGGPMIKVSVFYPNRKNAKFDMEYYCNSHMPLVRRLVGSALKEVSVDQGISDEEPGSAPPYVAMGHLIFDSVESFQTSFGPHTNVEPTIQISEVKL
jgi:uncharacterized protein (TIGR02118 family)